MGLFRKKNQTQIPELQEYYASQQRPLVAWLKALLTLLITIAIVLILFFGGRWLYRAITNDNDTPEPVQTGQPAEVDGVIDDTDVVVPDDERAGTGASSTATTTPNTQQDVRDSQSALPTSGALPQTGPSGSE